MGFGLRINFVDAICDDSFKNTYANGMKSGYQFDIRLSYYRGMYLSCIDRFEVYVDGEKAPDQDIVSEYEDHVSGRALEMTQR